MPIQFSQQLIERLQRHFKNRFQQEVSVEQANQYLHTFAELYGLFWDENPEEDQRPP